MLCLKKGPILPKKIKWKGREYCLIKRYKDDKYDTVEIYQCKFRHDPYYVCKYGDKTTDLGPYELDTFINLMFGGIKND